MASALNSCDVNTLGLGGRYIVERKPREKYTAHGKEYLTPAGVGVKITYSKTAAGAEMTARRSNHPFNSATYRLRGGTGTFDRIGDGRKEYRTFRTVTYVSISPKGKAKLEKVKSNNPLNSDLPQPYINHG